MTGRKNDQGKLRYTLLDPLVIEGIVKVLEYGAKKYEAHNWTKITDLDRIWNATYRHLEAIREGSGLDDESELPHIYHAMCNLSFLATFMEAGVDITPERPLNVIDKLYSLGNESQNGADNDIDDLGFRKVKF